MQFDNGESRCRGKKKIYSWNTITAMQLGTFYSLPSHSCFVSQRHTKTLEKIPKGITLKCPVSPRFCACLNHSEPNKIALQLTKTQTCPQRKQFKHSSLYISNTTIPSQDKTQDTKAALPESLSCRKENKNHREGNPICLERLGLFQDHGLKILRYNFACFLFGKKEARKRSD